MARLALAGAAVVSGFGSSRSPQPLPELLQGYDTTTQISALADWLRGQPAPWPRRVWIATDPDHTARAVLLARLALGGRGLRGCRGVMPTRLSGLGCGGCGASSRRPCESRSGVVPAVGREGTAGMGVFSSRWPTAWFGRVALADPRASTAG